MFVAGVHCHDEIYSMTLFEILHVFSLGILTLHVMSGTISVKRRINDIQIGKAWKGSIYYW